ncbi:MAG: isoaspartyl peptidase/L-asparaginase [Deltaproteobacteria bacterium]|nr:isoaspartyl peptidase/L-asparaginase [Deltaproteobacteria bacterium]
MLRSPQRNAVRLWLLGAAALVACNGPQSHRSAPSAEQSVVASAPAATTAPQPSLPPTPWTAAAIAHGGVGSPPARSDGCRKAVDAALATLESGGDPLVAAVAGVVVMEDDARFNAGTGSRVRLDGDTVQMDAAVMTSAGRFGAVAVIEKVKNPVKVASALLDTPHLLLAGDGATAFARTLGMASYDPATEEMRAATKAIQQRLLKADPTLPKRWLSFDWRSRWNFERTLAQAGLDETDVGTDTVGVAVRSADGRFAVALSTGGTSITLRGRVGDVPVYGAGLYAGPRGATAATGTGERIIEQSLSRRVHEWLAAGATPEQAGQRAVKAIGGSGAIGVIVIGPRQLAAVADRSMAWAARQAGAKEYRGPDPAAPPKD